MANLIKLGRSVVWRDIRLRVGFELEIRNRMPAKLYHPSNSCSKVPNQTITKSEKNRVSNGGLGAEPTAGGVEVRSPPLMLLLVVCPFKTNAGVYLNSLNSFYWHIKSRTRLIIQNNKPDRPQCFLTANISKIKKDRKLNFELSKFKRDFSG